MVKKRITEASVLALIKRQKITTSRAAELLNMPLQDFLDLMHKRGLILCNETSEEIREDLRDLKVLKSKVK